ncbi:hypothetical protein DFQ26_009403 [Actinomortierella ambigua]|nr:hypothetical protein DFQ26_009403 [Actinomortierella ambigua]
MRTAVDKTAMVVQHIVRHLGQPRRATQWGKDHVSTKPLIVGLSGPQGSGKTTMTRNLVKTLSGAPHNLRVFAFSMDDVYLPYEDQIRLSQQHPANDLLASRGLPGTHDIELGTRTFQLLCEANRLSKEKQQSVKVAVPSYDKSLHAGKGDQVPRAQWQLIQGPFDVVLFEGWSLGFKAVDQGRLEQLYKQSQELRQQYSTVSNSTLQRDQGGYAAQHSLESLEFVNEQLKEYEKEWYEYLDVFVHLSAPRLSTVFKWRQQQETELWKQRGSGMTDSQVVAFVERFMVAYELYLERLKTENVFNTNHNGTVSGYADISTRHLRVDLDEDRNAIGTTYVR